MMAEDEMLSDPLLALAENRMEAVLAFTPPTEAAEDERLDRFREVWPLAAASETIPLTRAPRALPLPARAERVSGAGRIP